MADGVEVDPRSLADLRKLGDAYKSGDKKLRARTSKSLRESASVLARAVPRIGSEKMPKRGGLAARLAEARGAVTVSLSSQRVSVSIRAKSVEGYALRKIDQGIVRHPVFGEKRLKLSKDGSLRSAWVAQRVPEHAFTDAFEAGAPLVRAKLRLAVQAALNDIAKEAT